MDIKRSGSHPSTSGPTDSFTGTVRIDSPFSDLGPRGRDHRRQQRIG